METCDHGLPRLVVHTDSTPANVHEAGCAGAIHEALSEAGLDIRSRHLVDASYVSAEQLAVANVRHGIDLIGPARSNYSWQRRSTEAIQVADFNVDCEQRRVRCPEGHESTNWGE